MGILLRHQDPVMPGAAAVPAANTSHGARLPRTVRTGPWPRFAVAGVVFAVIGVTLLSGAAALVTLLGMAVVLFAVTHGLGIHDRAP
jgi:hypothetical protein